MTAYLTLTAMLLFTIFPVLIPAGLHAVDAVRRRLSIGTLADYLRGMSPRVSVPDAA